MRVGVIEHPGVALDSIKHLFRATHKAVQDRHEVIKRPVDYWTAGLSLKAQIDRGFLDRSEILVGPIDSTLLIARSSSQRRPPYVALTNGSPPRGMDTIFRSLGFLTTSDVLVGNCTGEVDIVSKCISNASCALLPYGVDDSAYYAMSEADRRLAKADLGFPPNARLLLYSGRITLEKNLHTVLRMFGILQGLNRDLRLVIAGEVQNVPFMELGVLPVDLEGSLDSLIDDFGIDRTRVHLIGRRDMRDLCRLYNIADAAINFTLHHDENFGLAQVEAMVCGTPVIGTRWGGLKDTIVDEETGYTADVFVTPAGVKANWLEGVGKILRLLDEAERRERFRSTCISHAKRCYSLDQFGITLGEILLNTSRRTMSPEPLTLSPFGHEFLKVCHRKQRLAGFSYRPGTRSFELYRELISGFAAPGQLQAASSECGEDHLLTFAAPIRLLDGSVEIGDPIFPLNLPVPEQHWTQVCEITRQVGDRVVLESSLTGAFGEEFAELSAALCWMINVALLLRTPLKPFERHLSAIDAWSARSRFTTQIVNVDTDLVVMR